MSKGSAMSARTRWGDDDDDLFGDGGGHGASSGGAVDISLPPPQIIGPDANGVKTYIEYKINEKNQKVKVTKKVKVSKYMRRVTPGMVERRKWTPFGDAANARDQECRTVASIEDIYLERPRLQAEKTELEKDKDKLAAMTKDSATLMPYRSMRLRAKYRELAQSLGIEERGDTMPPGDDDGPPGSGSMPPLPSKGGYVPPSLRGGAAAAGAAMRDRRDENSLRVTNLSEDCREADLQELFRPFGPIQRIYVAYDRETGESRGFAFVNFIHHEDAARAKEKLDGFGYDNLILRVDWAAPRPERADGEGGGGGGDRGGPRHDRGGGGYGRR
ncbi:hypothetical protein PPROV_000159400 [Pycnococcus provasolii]|uniref:Eukaryotic translation initiation factor 3 subunit G n=1 Tax=Pycnococcus provasolii TaxID=41880 RepID=A0A830HBX5_9CHLO|nr:hypothetical protein PPROV_000159400 [Pycnococcus provasolii]|mmetsp:Transcript_4151/g.9283  ORF Transcript_4151/g.9283 Transcript_4151/m.9283 type:complete len:330 (-) Transcript_4151:50-1039(-)